MTNKILVFDMDGTIADLYGVDNWLSMLQAEDPSPYAKAEPIYEIHALNTLLHDLKNQGWKIIITTWLAKGASKEYNAMVRQTKLEWLDTYDFPYDEIHIVKYGTSKASCTQDLGGFQILVDDNEKVRASWTLGPTIDANQNIIKELQKLL